MNHFNRYNNISNAKPLNSKVVQDKSYEKKMVDELYNIYKNINLQSNEELECEIRLGRYNEKRFNSIVNNDLLIHFFKKQYLFKSSEIINTIELVNVSSNPKNRIKQILYFDDKFKKIVENGKMKSNYITKEQILKYDFYQKGIRVQLSKETSTENKPELFINNLARYKSRISFEASELFPYIKYDITRIWELNTPNGTNDLLSWNQIKDTECHFEFEIEINQQLFKEKKCEWVFEYMSHLLLNASLLLDRYSNPILDIYYILNIKKSFKHLNLHHITNSTISLSKDHIHILQENYSVTNKIDGERRLMWIVDNNLYLIDNKLNLYYVNTNEKYRDFNYTLLDGEFYTHFINHNDYLVFDILIYKNIPITQYNLLKRLENAKEVVHCINNNITLNDKPLRILMKEFYTTDIANNAVKLLENNTSGYELDGLIFTPINDGYYNKCFKWKQNEQLTNDFLLKYKESKNNKYYYLVFVGLNKLYCHESRKDIDYSIIDKYFPNLDKNENYLPVLFKNDNWDFSILETEELIDNDTVYECSFNYEKYKFEIYRIREDKTKLYKETNKIFGNDYKVAVNNLDIILKPVYINDFKEFNEKYYKTNKNKSLLISMRKYHNFAKKKLIEDCINILGMNTTKLKLMDIGCGRGGDLNKYADLGIKFGYFVDKDEYALFRDIDCSIEKYKTLKKSANKEIYYYFSQSDFTKTIEYNNDKYRNNEVIDKFEIDYLSENTHNSQGKFNLIICNFACHYAFASKETFDNFIEYIIDKVNTEKYCILFTYMDGYKTNKLLKKNNGELVKDAFIIKGEYNKTPSIGKEINVYIDSIGDSKEYLVYPEYIIEKLKETLWGAKVKQGNILDYFEDWNDDRYLKNYIKNKFNKVSEIHDYLMIYNTF